MITMDQSRFQEYAQEGTRPVLVEFWAPWCGYCRRIAPAMEKIAGQYAESLPVGQVNIDEEPELAEREGIEIIPTLVLYQQGEALGSIVAPDSKAKIEAFLRETLGGMRKRVWNEFMT